MASIALSVIGCTDYLAYGTIFTRVMFLPKKKIDVFFPARKAVDERWGVVRVRTVTLLVTFITEFYVSLREITHKCIRLFNLQNVVFYIWREQKTDEKVWRGVDVPQPIRQ
jgi:hypothetical protein